jgi:hypothetical protein
VQRADDSDQHPVDPLLVTERAAREVLRVYDRYAREVVEAFDFCPWASSARRSGAAVPGVIFQRDLEDLEPSLQAISQLEMRANVSVGLLIYPCLPGSRLDFEHFVRKLRHADSLRYEPGQLPFAMAAFHPQGALDQSSADRLVPFVRRSPDATLQLVRQSALEAVRGDPNAGTALMEPWMMSTRGRAIDAPPSIREKIARNNLRTVERLGASSIEARLADIQRDREQTYAELAATFGGDGFPETPVIWWSEARSGT